MSDMDERLSRHMEFARQAHASGAGLDRILTSLRREGLSITESIWTIRSVTGMSLTEAKLLIQESDAWSDVRDSTMQDHAELRRIVEERMELSSRERQQTETQPSHPERSDQA